MTATIEHLLKGKAQHSWPPYKGNIDTDLGLAFRPLSLLVFNDCGNTPFVGLNISLITCILCFLRFMHFIIIFNLQKVIYNTL